MSSISLQVVSDLHLEFTPDTYPRIPARCKYIALCGDIGCPLMNNYLQFIAYLSKTFQRVLLLFGNHEYYSSSYSKEFMDLFGQNMCRKFSNVHWLTERAIELDGVKIVGSVLWSYIPPEHWGEYRSKIRNYSHIRRRDLELITPVDTNRWNRQAIRFIQRHLESNTPVLLLTHYPPITFDTGRKTAGLAPIQHPHHGDLHYAYYNHLIDLLQPNVIGWCFGHTHERCRFRFRGVTFLSNAGGYPGELSKEYDYSCVGKFEIVHRSGSRRIL